VAFTVGSRSGITVPASSIVRSGQLTSLFVVGKDGIARMRLVTIGEPQGDRVEVLSGIDAGETIVTAVGNGVRDGTRVIPSRRSRAATEDGRGIPCRSTTSAASAEDSSPSEPAPSGAEGRLGVTR
jgi:hypothetical protein